MGQEVCRAVAVEDDLVVAAAVDPHHAGSGIADLAGIESDVIIAADNDALVAADVDVLVDFTNLDAARSNLDFCATAGIHAVVGTSGFTIDDHADIAERFTSSNCLIAPNFAIGAVLLIRFAELAAPFFETAEIIELHHDGKVDAPSGTAINTAERMAVAGGDWAGDPTETETISGARGAKGAGGIPIHSVRMRGMTAHQEVVLGTTGQSLNLRHDSYDRSSFMPGVVLAVRKIADVPGLTIGLDGMLDL
jgi:4-hydroxy-tetrahydrodipicolinate reductase